MPQILLFSTFLGCCLLLLQGEMLQPLCAELLGTVKAVPACRSPEPLHVGDSCWQRDGGDRGAQG